MSPIRAFEAKTGMAGLGRRVFCNCAASSFRPATLDADSLESLPTTSTDKIDYQKLKGMK